jgi:hypothetical protein
MPCCGGNVTVWRLDVDAGKFDRLAIESSPPLVKVLDRGALVDASWRRLKAPWQTQEIMRI